MADRLLLESSAVDGYLNEDGSGVILQEFSAVSYTLTCAAGSYAYTGQPATLSVKHSLACSPGTYVYSGIGASLLVAHRLTCDAGAYSLAGQAATLSVKHGLSCDSGAYSYAGISAQLSVKHNLVCEAGAYSLTGQAATLTYTPGVVSYSLLCDSGSYAIAGVSADLVYSSTTVIPAPLPAYRSGGSSRPRRKQPPRIIQSVFNLQCSAGNYSLSGSNIVMTYIPGTKIAHRRKQEREALMLFM